MYVVSSSSEEVSLSSFTKDLGENHWSSYFHQASIGTHSTHKFHSPLTGRFEGQCDTKSSSIKEDTFNSLGLVPKGTKYLKEHVEKFLVGHSTTTIISISILGPEFTTFLGELHYSPYTSVRAWMLVSRLSLKHEPVVLLLSLDPIPQAIKTASIAKVGHVDEPWSAVVPNAADKSASKAAFIKKLKHTFNVLGKERKVSRKPVILVLDYDVQMLPWESLPIIRCEEISRMPSVSSIFAVLDEGSFASIDPLNAFYLINPEKNLDWHKETEVYEK